MRLDDISKIEQIAQKANFVIFELPKSYKLENILTKSPHLKPNESEKITVESIREFTTLAQGKQASDLILVVEKPETMNESAANAFLKNLEEPNDKIHYVFLSHNASSLLPTIISRAQNYYFETEDNPLDSLSDKEKAEVKKYITAKQTELLEFAQEFTKKKEGQRERCLKLVENAILLCHQSYLTTGNQQFLNLLEKLQKTHQGLSANGNIKLQLVANML